MAEAQVVDKAAAEAEAVILYRLPELFLSQETAGPVARVAKRARMAVY